MNEKYSLKIIQHGKTQQVRTVQNGAGMAGQAVVIQATDAARFQLVNVVTLVSPAKLQLKRVGDALHLVLPGGDIEAPDLVIQDYFKVTGASLQGSSINGEWMNYDTASLATNPAPSVAGTDTLSSSVVDKTSNVSLGGEGVLGTFTEHPWLWAGGIAGAAAAGGGGGGGGSTPASDTSPLAVIQAYANATAGAGVTAPTLATYKSSGVKALANLSETTASADIDSATVTGALGVTSAAWLATLNSAVDKRTDGSTLTVAQLQVLADSYYRILSEADGVVNTSTDTIVYPSTGISNPTATDYINIGATVGNAKSVDLLNDFVGLSLKTAVDTVDEINTVAAAAYNVILKAGVAAGTGNLPAAYTLDSEWITGLTALGIVGVNANNIVAVKAAIAATATTGTANDGVEVDTVLEIKDLVKGAIALQVMVDYTNTNGTSAAPSLTTYTDAGIKAFASLTDTLGADRVALSASNADINALNSALDKLTGSSLTLNTTTDGTVQKMVDSYYRILKEADGSTTTNTDVYADTTNDATNAAAYNDPTATDYANVGVTKADGTALTVVSTTNSEIVALLNDAVGRFSTTSVDTVAELSALEKAAENIMAIGAGTGTGLATTGVTYTTDAEWIAGFTALGVTGVTTANLAAVKKAIDAADVGTAPIPAGTPIDTVQELLDLVKPVIALQVLVDYTNTNGTSAAPSLTTYTDAGIKAFASLTDTLGADRVALSASNADINALNSALDKLTGSSLTLNTTTDGTVQKMVDSYYRILKEADGKYIGDANGSAAYYDGSTVAKTADTDVYADTTNDATNAAAYNDPTATDYANIGVTKINATALTVASAVNTEILTLLNNAVGRFNTTKVDTIAELSALEMAAENVFALSSGGALGTVSYTGATADADWVAGLTALGVTGVTTSNITAVKAAIDAKDNSNDGTAVDTVAELQAVVSLARMVAFTNDGAAIGSKVAATPTLVDWGALVNVNTSLFDATLINLDVSTYWKSNPTNGVNALNSALDTYAGLSLTTAAPLKTIADSYGRVLQDADGSRTNNTDVSKVDGSANTDLVVADLTNLGVTFLNTAGTVIPANTVATLAAEKNLLLDAIGGLFNTAVDTVTELNDLAKIADNVVKQAAGGTVTYLDSEWVSALSSLSITGANTTNIATIKTNIAATADIGSGVDSYNELQSIVSLVRVNDYAALNTGYVLPTIEDYQALVATSGTAGDVTTYGLTAISTSNAGGSFVAYSNANSAYLSSYNDAVNSKPSGAFTGTEVKNLVLAYNSILAEANGTTSDQTTYDPLGSDYLAVGVGSGTSIDTNITTMLNVTEYATLLTDVIANKTTTQVDQVSELNALASIIVKIQDLEGKTATGGANYTAITGGALQVSELASLGLDTSNLTNTSYSGSVLVNRLNNVYDNIIAVDHTSSVSRATLDSLAEMQALINNTSGIVI